MNQRHQKEMTDLETLIHSTNKNIKFSTQYQQLVIGEESLAKQQK
jgi:hypothetical protein